MLVGHIRRHHQRAHAVFARRRARFLKQFAAPARQHHAVTLSQEFQRHRPAYARARSGHQATRCASISFVCIGLSFLSMGEILPQGHGARCKRTYQRGFTVFRVGIEPQA